MRLGGVAIPYLTFEARVPRLHVPGCAGLRDQLRHLHGEARAAYLDGELVDAEPQKNERPEQENGHPAWCRETIKYGGKRWGGSLIGRHWALGRTPRCRGD
jgi:hypothetical protein